jgi:hypothetical protein
MSYAIRNDGLGWRAVNGPEDVGADETFSESQPVPLAPTVVIAPASPRQIRQALTRAGLRQAVEGAIAAGDQDTKDWWEFATQFERQHARVIAMGAALGQTDAQLDALWALAVSL